MKLSDAGLALICEFEGYHTALKDGGCAAYLCPAGVVTIGFGCTEGVKIGDVWTREQANEALRRELAKHEAAVTRLVTVDVTQGQYDALVSFSYNVGAGALKSSTLLKKLNRGDNAGACAEFGKWNKAAGKVLRGLTIRRAKEAALFATRDDAPAMMAQKIETPKEPMTPAKIATVVAGGATVVNQAVPAILPTPAAVTPVAKTVAAMPKIAKPPAETVEALAGWKGLVVEYGAFATSNPKLTMILVAVVAVGSWLMWPKREA